MPWKKGAVGKNTAQEDSPNVAELKSLVKWEKSDGKIILKKELWNVNFAFQSMSIKDIHSSDACFSVYPLKNFSTNFKNLKKKVDVLEECNPIVLVLVLTLVLVGRPSAGARGSKKICFPSFLIFYS